MVMCPLPNWSRCWLYSFWKIRYSSLLVKFQINCLSGIFINSLILIPLSYNCKQVWLFFFFSVVTMLWFQEHWHSLLQFRYLKKNLLKLCAHCFTECAILTSFRSCSILYQTYSSEWIYVVHFRYIDFPDSTKVKI